MASLELRHKTFRVVFLHAGKKHGFSLDTGDRHTAEALRGGVEKTLMLLGQGALRVPPGADFLGFIKSGGQCHEPPRPAPEVVTFAGLRDRYLAAYGNGAVEPSSLATLRIHLKHLGETFGEMFPVTTLALADVQRHVDRRAASSFRGKWIGPVTIRKEVTTFRAAWNWGLAGGLVAGVFPVKGLVYAKTDEKPPFMTRAEIGRKLPGLTAEEQAGLWECLYLPAGEVAELLAFVRGHATAPWLYPLLATAAYTGARRSELLRAEVTDVGEDALLVREKKRSKTRRTTRHVSLTPALKAVLADWLAAHPGGRSLFATAGVVARSRTRGKATGHQSKGRPTTAAGRKAMVTRRAEVPARPVTKGEAHDHLRRTVAGSKWDVLKGIHTLRHSFISALAAAGVDQRIVDDFVGHATAEQQKRYRHLLPSLKQQAVAAVFG